ncbi:MAG TPA: diphosphate--fructose-6-phosphate 1-phosphotransferase [Planctomycetota bacterium]|nr:diphosphate--fructose-6-phosphate 1-phosphotransferase [Planctomycetota bacterium]
MSKRTIRLGILCGGGPAPGMNSVICAATIEAVNSGWQVFGIPDGFSQLMLGDTSHVHPLLVEDVSRIHLQGGSVLFTSRANPSKRPETLRATVAALKELRLDALLTIGGDDTGHSAAVVANAAAGALRIAHVPKTIDNDLPLPGDVPTFGYQTARHVGAEQVSNLMTDALTTRRWFFVVAMGRQAGHLAQGIGKSAGATVTVIPEDFPAGQPIHLDHIVDILETSIYKRIAHGRPFGVAVMAEGLSLRFPPEELDRAMPNAERDDHGHVRLSEVHLHRLLTDLVRARVRQRGHEVTIVAKNIGYELRSAPPIPFDIEYTRDLGYGAIDYLRGLLASEQTVEVGAMVTIQRGELVPLRFGTFNDPATGRPRVRTVNPESEAYRVAREYQIRLEPDDFSNGDRLEAIARAANMTAAEFQQRYGYIVERDAFRPRN